MDGFVLVRVCVASKIEPVIAALELLKLINGISASVEPVCMDHPLAKNIGLIREG